VYTALCRNSFIVTANCVKRCHDLGYPAARINILCDKTFHNIACNLSHAVLYVCRSILFLSEGVHEGSPIYIYIYIFNEVNNVPIKYCFQIYTQSNTEIIHSNKNSCLYLRNNIHFDCTRCYFIEHLFV